MMIGMRLTHNEMMQVISVGLKERIIDNGSGGVLDAKHPQPCGLRRNRDGTAWWIDWDIVNEESSDD